MSGNDAKAGMVLSTRTLFIALSAGELNLFHRASTGELPGPLHFLATFRGPCLVPLQLTAGLETLEIRAGEGARFELRPTLAESDRQSTIEQLLLAADQFLAGMEAPLASIRLLSVFPGEQLVAPLPAGVFAGSEAVIIEAQHGLEFGVLGQTARSSRSGLLYLPKRAWASLTPSGPPAEPTPRIRNPRELGPDEVVAATGELVGQLIALGISRATAAEVLDHSGVQTRQGAVAGALRRGVRSLAAVLVSRHPQGEPVAGDALLAQIGFLWQRQGITAQPADAATQGTTLERARVIAEASGVRSRTVALKGIWWQDECGLLLAQTENGGEPVVLFREREQYQLRDASGAVCEVNAGSAATLAGFALAFYRALPAGKITAWGLVRHALFGRVRPLAKAIALSLALTLLSLMAPVIMSQLIDFAIPSAEGGQILVLVGGLALAAVIGATFQYAQSVLILSAESQVNQEMECAVWDRLLRLPADFFKRYTIGDLAQRASSINRIRATLSGKAISGALAGLFAAANFAVLFAFSPTAAGYALLLALPVALLLGGFTVVSTRWQRKVIEGEAELSSVTFEILSAVAKIRTTASESFALLRWAGAYSEVRRRTFHLQLLESGFGSVVGFYGNLSLAALYTVAGYMMLNAAGGSSAATLTSGQFIGFMAAFATFMQGMGSLARTIAELNEIKPMYDRVTPILHTPAESAGQQGNVPEIRGAIDVVALSFGYSKTTPVLNEVSLAIRPGEFVALVGASGSGKSTLLRLLLGFEKPDAGEIRYEGVSLEDMDLRALRRRFGVVLQHGMLVPSDIFSNIRGVTDASMEDCWAAAAAVALDAEIKAMPMGLMTMISEGASTISGGQRQRILLARALVKKPKIVYLDEATSALDNISQAVVTESLNRLAATRVVIAHRLSTIRHADRIVVLDAGRIVEEGRFDDLMARKGFFHRLSSRQTTAS